MIFEPSAYLAEQRHKVQELFLDLSQASCLFFFSSSSSQIVPNPIKYQSSSVQICLTMILGLGETDNNTLSRPHHVAEFSRRLTIKALGYLLKFEPQLELTRFPPYLLPTKYHNL